MVFLGKYFYKNLKVLKTSTTIVVLIIITLYNLSEYFIFSASKLHILINITSSVLIAGFLLFIIFRAFDHQHRQREDQLKQLTDAYQYIGKINRKIDSLLELDISTLDRSKDYPVQQASEDIFNQLRALVNAQAGVLILKKPFNFKIYNSLLKDDEVKTVLDRLAKKELRLFKYSQRPEYKQKFIEHGVEESFFKKYDILSKPVYMHDQDIGLMLFIFKKGAPIEDRDINIIRVFSFYLALTVTFKPDFSNKQT